MKERIYERLWEILTGKDSSFQQLFAKNKGVILEILRQTKPGLPDYWKE